ncbi:MAG TPA: EF-Tu/IF-2/RF-3 family GTPase [Thermoplasmata archaeon]|nr:EF-Tu/IF-2/RF-3 family GTPase [Thermoplasmata archaeon]
MAAPATSLTVGLFGGDLDFLKQIGSALGKKGTESDLLFWNKKEREIAITAIAPVTYPERLVPMLQVASLCDLPVLVADALDAAFGETMIALSALGKKGLLILRNPQTAERARALAKDRLHGWIALEWAGDESFRRLRELIPDTVVARDAHSLCTVVVDHAFAVRGVGTVALGFVRRGILRVHDELRLAPLDRSVLVRSIQRFDEDQTEAPPGSRVGVALKGIESHEIERGFLLTADAAIVSNPEARLKPFHRLEFAKDPLESGARAFHLQMGLYSRPVVLDEVGDALKATADRPMPLFPGEKAFLTVLRGSGGLRILGHGDVVP